MHFDWYQATIPANPGVIVDALMRPLGVYKTRELDSGRYGYKLTTQFLDPENGVLATLLHGSDSASPNVTGSGYQAAPVAKVVRATWPAHRVTRVDVAEDLTEEGLYTRVSTAVRQITAGSGMDSGLSIQPDDPKKGSTYYVGAKTSTTRIRVYEKGRQIASQGLYSADPPDPNHVRVELQYRPAKDAKARAARLEPREFWGVAAWTKQIAATVLHVDVPRLKLTSRPLSDQERSFNHVMTQFHRLFMAVGETEALRRHGLVRPTPDEIIDAVTTRIAERLDDDERIRLGLPPARR